MKRFLGVLLVLVLVFSLAPYGTVQAASFTVTNINDSSPGSLRQAILDANASPGTDTIDFSIPGGGPHTIQPLSALPTITDPVIIDGYTQPGASRNTNPPGTGLNTVLMIELDGSNAGSPFVDGLLINAGNSMVRGVVINRFSRHGVHLETNGGNVIEGSFIGIDVTGSVDLGNAGHGIGIYGGSSGNTIGGTTAGARNVISGNEDRGIGIFDNSTGNLLQGNLIGTDVTGTVDLGNSASGVAIFYSGASSNIIGGTTAEARNVISGNDAEGVSLWNDVTGNLVQGNFIGTDVTGTVDLGNSLDGVQIQDAPSNTIGGTTTGARNLISGNDNNGVWLRGSSSMWNLVQGNFIGTDVTGTAALGNFGGVFINESASNNTIGGTTAVSRNVISGNDRDGIGIAGSEAIGNMVQGNFIGTDVTGTNPLGNGWKGVWVVNAPNNTIGGTMAGARNVISGNVYQGILLQDSEAIGNVVQGNFIGTDVTGTNPLGNGQSGVWVAGAPNNTIGGTMAEARNVISGNGWDGISIGGSSTTGNLVQGNFIGTDVSGTSPLGNNGTGVSMWAYAINNTIGGATPGAGNVISANDGNGVDIFDSSTGNAILSNSIFSNTGLGIDLRPDGVTPNDVGDGDTGANNLQNFPVLTSATSGSSITIEGTLNSTPDTVFRLEFFSNTASDPTGYGEGENFLGSTDVPTDGGGNVSFVATFPDTVPAGQFVTSTATDPNNNTSEFSECVQVVAAPSEVWVDDNYTPGGYNDGHTWGYDAFATIQDGIDAVSSSIVHVAAGTYYENITLKDGVDVLGAGADVTTIDGGGAGSVVTAIGIGSETVLDGFTIMGGSSGDGGGMYNEGSSPKVTNCTFSSNSAGWGGGMYNGESSPMVIDCIFNGNTASNGGGGIYNHDYSSPKVTNCTFSSNSATWGGGMQNHNDSSPTLTNCTFSSNSATWGGGLNNDESSPTVINCTFSENSATTGGSGMSNGGSSPIVTNCILWDIGIEIADDATSTPLVTYCDVQGGYPGGNIDADPMFADALGGDYHLLIGSPCIDTGDNNAPSLPVTDFEGDPRILPVGGDVDMGADEYVPSAVEVEATLDFNPNTLNVRSKGKWITCYIELEAGYDVNDIDVTTILLNDTVSAELKPATIGDYDSDGVPDLMVKFNRALVQELLTAGNEVEVTVSGELTDDTPFEGTDTIRVAE